MSIPSLVSVIMPAYNASQFVERSLKSVLSQTYEHLEVIVVDDGSTDDTATIVDQIASRDRRVRLLQQQNAGVAAARNRAIDASHGEFIAPIDADDIWFSAKIERQVQRMNETGPDTGLVYCWWVALREDDKIIGVAPTWDQEGDVLEALIYVNFVGNASVPLIRRTAIDEVGGYDTEFRTRGGQGCEDWDMSLRIAERFEFAVVPAYLSGYRSVMGSMSANTGSMGLSFEFTMEKLQARHPDIDPVVFKWSRSNFYPYLASLSYNAGDFPGHLLWTMRAIKTDPAMLLSAGAYKMLLKSSVRLLVRPLTVRIWPTHQDWLSFKTRIIPDGQEYFTEQDIEESTEVGVSPWAWRSWMPYDRICINRWRQLSENTQRMALSE